MSSENRVEIKRSETSVKIVDPTDLSTLSEIAELVLRVKGDKAISFSGLVQEVQEATYN